MIDVHAHVLPAIDDGAASVHDSIRMLSDSRQQGVSHVVATPHCRPYTDSDILSMVEKRKLSYSELVSAQSMAGYEMPELTLGFEVYLCTDVAKLAHARALCIGATDAMLLEMPYARWTQYDIEAVYNLTVKGICPIIAHIERYADLWGSCIQELLQLSCIYQVNADTLLTIRGRRLALSLIKHGYRVLVGSDMHNMDVRRSNMKKAYAVANRKFGAQDAQQLFLKEAAAILGG